MKRYPIGQQDFADIIETHSIYVDKTDIIYNLTDRCKYVFLARPRRFGKSLLLSTIKYYLGGRKELFEGLRIMDLEKKWTKHPVLHLSFATFQSNNERSLVSILENQFQKWEKLYGVDKSNLEYAERFRNIIEAACETTGEKAVILVDEY
ncbi:MAG: AAA family ATPase, partial [Muribaculaceae bacterium]|nr:AAA family ATPase [Muribaculaceae bacterium]